MSLSAKWTATCTGCGKTVERELELTETTADYDDIWVWGIPDGWLQLPYDDVTDRHYLFFHSKDCYYSWLEGQGRHKEAKEAREAVWAA